MKKAISLRLSAAAASLFLAGHIHAAGIPVVDGLNLTQQTMNVISTMAQEAQQVLQYAQQVQQYQTQLQQYANMLQNTQVPGTWIFNDTMQILQNAQNLYSQFGEMSGIEQYLAQYVDPQFLETNPCVSGQGTCTAEAWNQLVNQQQQLASDKRDQLNQWFSKQAQLESVFQQSDQTIQSLKASSQTAQGQMEAISYTNMMLGALSDQFGQMRGIMMEILRNQKAKELEEAARRKAKENFKLNFAEGALENQIETPGAYYDFSNGIR